jgi:C-terminal processing protease CtpA/Prc
MKSTTKSIGYIHLKTFLPSDPDKFLYELGYQLRNFVVTEKISDLIVDVRGNNGGANAILSAILDLFFGDKGLYFSDQESQLLKTDHMKKMANLFVNAHVWFYFFFFLFLFLFLFFFFFF